MPNQFVARDADNNLVTLESLPTVGQKNNSASLPFTLSTEQNTTLSAIASSVAGTLTVSGNITVLGSPFQTGDSIGNTSFGISGNLPSFAVTPTVNLGTIGGAATAAKQDAIVAALGSPLQAGGSVLVVSNTSTYQEITITIGGTAQSLFSGVTPTNGYEIINNDTTETLYYREAGTAAAGGASSIAIQPGAAYTTPRGYKPTGLVSVVAATPGHALVARSY